MEESLLSELQKQSDELALRMKHESGLVLVRMKDGSRWWVPADKAYWYSQQHSSVIARD